VIRRPTDVFDMQAYTDCHAGKLEDLKYDEKEIGVALAGLPSVGR